MVFEVVSDSCNNSLLCGPWNMIMIIPWKLNLASFDLSANTKSNYVSCFTASPKVSIEIWNICVRLLYWESFQHCREYIVSQSTEANQVKWDKERERETMTSTFIQNGTLDNYTQSKWYETSVWNIHIKTFINDLLELPKRP